MDFRLFQKNNNKYLGNKYSKKILDRAKISTADTIENAWKIAVQNSRSNWWFNSFKLMIK